MAPGDVVSHPCLPIWNVVRLDALNASTPRSIPCNVLVTVLMPGNQTGEAIIALV